MTATSTFRSALVELVVGQQLGIPRDPRGRALFCCRHMHDSFAPRSMPLRPGELSSLGRDEIAAMRARAEGGKVDDSQRVILEAARAYDGVRSGVLYENASRLRGALWASVTLAAAVAADPSDSEAEEFSRTLHNYLFDAWGPPCEVTELALQRAGLSAELWQAWATHRAVPDSFSQRDRLARFMAELLALYDSGRLTTVEQPAQRSMWAVQDAR